MFHPENKEEQQQTAASEPRRENGNKEGLFLNL